VGQVTVDDLLAFGPLQASSAASWGYFLAGVEQKAAFLQTGVSQPLADAWTGTAAELAASKIGTTHGGLITSAANLAKIQGVLTDFSGQMTGLAGQMRSAVNQAVGMQVTADGDVTFTTDGPYTPAEQTKLTTVQTSIKNILSQADSLDSKAAAQLLQYMPGPATLAPAATATMTAEKWSTVSTNGSLWQMAQKEYGDGSKWTLIYDANKATIGSDPSLIQPGMKLKIPTLGGSAGTATGSINGTTTGPASAPAASGKKPAPAASSPAADGDSTTPPPGVSPAEWNVS
jgi:hypothetical protein